MSEDLVYRRGLFTLVVLDRDQDGVRPCFGNLMTEPVAFLEAFFDLAVPIVSVFIFLFFAMSIGSTGCLLDQLMRGLVPEVSSAS